VRHRPLLIACAALALGSCADDLACERIFGLRVSSPDGMYRADLLPVECPSTGRAPHLVLSRRSADPISLLSSLGSRRVHSVVWSGPLRLHVTYRSEHAGARVTRWVRFGDERVEVRFHTLPLRQRDLERPTGTTRQ
jgi:hypothetical protein